MSNLDVKRIWLLKVFAICVLSLRHDHKMVAAEDCEVEFQGIEIECTYYMNKGDPRLLSPNDRCCKAISDAYPKLECVCNSLSQKAVFPPGGTIADVLSWKRMMHCFSYCSLPLPAGYKCNKFTVPNPPPK